MLFTILAIDEKIPKCIEEPTDQTEWESHFGIKRIGKICLIFSPIYIEEKKQEKTPVSHEYLNVKRMITLLVVSE